LLTDFYDSALPAFRANSQNFPRSCGLAIGLAAGPVTFATVVGELAVVGPAVVGASRMVAAAEASETLANSYLGEQLSALPVDGYPDLRVTRLWRPTKDYKDHDEQAVYALRFEDLALGY
jgi:class 3 adenylate cyclase